MENLYKKIDYDESFQFSNSHKQEDITLKDVNNVNLKAFDYMQVSEHFNSVLICGMESRGDIYVTKFEDDWFMIGGIYLCDGIEGVFKCVNENFDSLFRPYK